MCRGWRGTLKANYDHINLVMQAGHDDGSAGCTPSTRLLLCRESVIYRFTAFYSQHTFIFIHIAVIAKFTRIRRRRHPEDVKRKDYKEFVGWGEEWCLNPKQPHTFSITLGFSGILVTQEAFVILRVQRGDVALWKLPSFVFVFFNTPKWGQNWMYYVWGVCVNWIWRLAFSSQSNCTNFRSDFWQVHEIWRALFSYVSWPKSKAF